MGVKGIKLMEVYSIRYFCYDRLKPEEQCGTISLVSDTGFQYLYNVQKGDLSNPAINCRDEIVPTVDGPTSSFRNLRMEFNLFNEAYLGHIPLEWDSRKVYDGLASFHDKRVRSRDGTGEISVLLGFYGRAIIASLEISLLNKSAASSVHGAVFAANSKLDLPKCTSLLFFKQPHAKIKVAEDGVIPLSKSRVAVPSLCKLYVDISLHTNDGHHTTTACFDAKKAEPEVHSTTHVVVKVNWDVDKESTSDTVFPRDEPGLERPCDEPGLESPCTDDFACVDMEL